MSEEKTRQEALEEKKKWSIKYFDYAESAIKEWIALELEESVELLFDDYNDESDFISINVADDNYTFYLTPFPNELTDDSAFKIPR